MLGLSRLECLVKATLLPLLFLSTTCSGHNTYFVKPTPDTQCPAYPCLTLSEYAQQPYPYGTSNTTLLLLPGDHTLTVNFTVENITDFEIRAHLSPNTRRHAVMIVCQGLVGFVFRNISRMAVRGLTFNSCGKRQVAYNAYSDYITIYGLSIHFGQDIEISNCSVQDSVGTAMGVFYSILNLRGSNSFTSNCRACTDGDHIHVNALGGGIYANTSTLVFSGSSIFGGNSAESGGGIYVENSIVIFTGNHAFNNNSAQHFGGGMSVLNTALNFTGNSTFRGNSAKDGGGIFTQHNTVYFTGNNTFTDNSAVQGGGISLQNSNLNFTGSKMFRNNSGDNIIGGGIFAENSTLAFTGDSIFTGSSGGLFGGGIAVLFSTLNLNGNSIFRNNSVQY